MSSSTPGSAPNVGRHICVFEDPDTIFMELNGEVSAEEGSLMNHLHLQMGEGRERLFLLIDMGSFEGMDAEVRKESGLTMKTLPLRGIAVYNASFKAKVIAKLIVSAMNLFKSSAERAPFEVFDGPGSARAWIAKRRGELAAAA